MECKTAESDLPLIQAERTEEGEEPPPLLHFNSAWGCAPSSRTQITIEIGPQSGTIPSYSYTEPRTAVLWDDRVPMGSAVLAIRWNTGRLPGVTQPEKLATMTPVGGPLLFHKQTQSLLGEGLRPSPRRRSGDLAEHKLVALFC
jgi:hypothetical protein